MMQAFNQETIGLHAYRHSDIRRWSRNRYYMDLAVELVITLPVNVCEFQHKGFKFS